MTRSDQASGSVPTAVLGPPVTTRAGVVTRVLGRARAAVGVGGRADPGVRRSSR
jgi:hypothetical protein